MQGSLTGYNNYSTKMKYKVPMIAAQLQELATLDESLVYTITDANLLSIGVPTPHCLCKGVTAMQRHCAEREFILKIKEVKQILQHESVYQKVIGENYTAIANPSKGKDHCKFYHKNHRYTNCPNRKLLKESAMEYILSTGNLNNAYSLVARPKIGTPTTDKNSTDT